MKLGQHFLMDRAAISRIANYADLGRQDNVLEIGPGSGNLTEALASRAGHIFAVEIDPDLAAQLSGRFSNVQVIMGDALKVPLPHYNKIVSNLPYQISSKITYRLLSQPFETAVLMYQWEFAERMAAAAGSSEYGRLAMVAGFFCQIEILGLAALGAGWQAIAELDAALLERRPEDLTPDEAASLVGAISRKSSS